jgi:hypothetical protein
MSSGAYLLAAHVDGRSLLSIFRHQVIASIMTTLSLRIVELRRQ